MNRQWTIQSIEHVGVCYNPETGAPRAADGFKVELQREDSSITIDVALTTLAGREIDFQFGAQKASLPERNRLATRAIEEFVALSLAHGWDPEKNPSLLLNGDAVGAVISRMK